MYLAAEKQCFASYDTDILLLMTRAEEVLW